MKRAVITLALLSACSGAPPASAEPPAGVQISRFSNMPVPRFETLKHEKVNGRKGPSEEYQVNWEYARKRLPVLIVKASRDWRYVRDPAGDEVWIKSTQLSDRAYALTTGAFVLKSGRAKDSDGVAKVPSGALVGLGTCDETMCQVTAGRYRGWAPRAQLWGSTATKG